MEWNTKPSVHWDWDSLIMFNAASNGSPKKLQPTVWDFDVEGGIKSGSIYSSGGGDGGGVSGSDLGLASLSKTSKSESTDSPLTVEVKTSKITLEANQATPEECTTTKELAQAKPTGTSPVLEASVGSGEPFLSLKLGKRAYFEDGCARSNTKTSSLSLIPVSSVSTEKKMKSLFQNTQVPCCQVEGCNLELTSAKDYHRKHRVCETHSKFPKVIVNGLERRFCQQCSRFHSLPEFDEKKRSCRRRLTDHNARRRKPQPESFRLNAARLPSSLYGIEEPRTPSNVDATQEHHRALSLLSSDSRISCQPKSSSFKLPMHTHHANMPQTAVHAIPQGRPLPSSDCWRGEQRSSSSRGHSLASANDGSNFTPGFQLYGNGFYANRLN